jgi:hypothetical protein
LSISQILHRPRSRLIPRVRNSQTFSYPDFQIFEEFQDSELSQMISQIDLRPKSSSLILSITLRSWIVVSWCMGAWEHDDQVSCPRSRLIPRVRNSQTFSYPDFQIFEEFQGSELSQMISQIDLRPRSSSLILSITLRSWIVVSWCMGAWEHDDQVSCLPISQPPSAFAIGIRHQHSQKSLRSCAHSRW